MARRAGAHATVTVSRTVSAGKRRPSWNERPSPARARAGARRPVRSRAPAPVRAMRPRSTVEESRHRVEQRGLPRAVRADERDDLARVHLELHVVERGDAAVVHRESRRPRARCRRTSARRRRRVGRVGWPRGRAAEEHRVREVGSVAQSAGRALVAHLAALEVAGPVGERERGVERLVDDHDRRARGAEMLEEQLRTRVSAAGARPRPSSSTSNRRGRVTNAIARVRSCCSPPERSPARQRAAVAQLGEAVERARRSPRRARWRPSTPRRRRFSVDGERREHAVAARCLHHPTRDEPFRTGARDVVAVEAHRAVLARAARPTRRATTSTCPTRSCRRARRSRRWRRRGRRRRAPARRRCARRGRAPVSSASSRRSSTGRSALGRPRRRAVHSEPVDSEQGGRGDAPPTRDPSQPAVAHVGERGAEAAAEHEQHHEQPDAGHEELPVGGQPPRDPAHGERAEDRAGDRAEAADHDHREHHEALARAVGVELQAVLLVHEERAGERGEEPRHRERAQAWWRARGCPPPLRRGRSPAPRRTHGPACARRRACTASTAAPSAARHRR